MTEAETRVVAAWKEAATDLGFQFTCPFIDALQIDGFNHQNPIIGLSIVPAERFGEGRGFHVQWGGTCMQHDVSFTCGRVVVSGSST